MKSRQSKKAPIYQIKVTLKDSKPPIWRRLQVAGDTTLYGLHLILQEAMGWENYHLHQFIVGRTYFGEPDPDFDAEDDSNVKLGQIVQREKQKFTYEYDFGDDWLHEILLEKILPPEPGVRYPVCLKGKRACPPEDCGGVWGYDDLLETIKDPGNEEYEEMMDWLGGEFDPEAFDLDSINQRLKSIR
jgi:hypothetical protein